MRHYDFLGQELFDGDEVVTIRKNGRAVGGSLTKATIKIENGKLSNFSVDILIKICEKLNIKLI